MSKIWTQEERYILKKYYGKEPIESLLERLPGRTDKSIYLKVHRLRKQGWTFHRKTDD